MKPFAWILTYQGAPTRAIAQEADALAELARLNRAYRGDRDRRELVPVFTARQPLGERQLRDLVHQVRTDGTVDVIGLARAIEQAHGIGQ